MASRPNPAQLFARVQADDLDGALQAGLMDYIVRAGDDRLLPDHPDLPQRLCQAQQQLRAAWAARERYRARAVRLARREAERDARRTPAPAGREARPARCGSRDSGRAKARASGKEQ